MGQMPQPGDAFGRYQVTGRIGRGGMGVVFSARQVDLGRDVALKLLSPDLADSEEYRNRFIREAAALARLDSPHVISVHDAGEQDGWLYIATQLIGGGDLSQRLASWGPLPPSLALDLLSQAASGLTDAHEVGIIHRDLKPSNILLRDRPNGDITAYICDLGIARTEGSEHTRTTGVIGTLGYMAPERHQGLPATASSDIYAMGCLLWAMLTGSAPYVGTDLAVALAHLQEPVPQLDPRTPGALVINQLLLTAMAKNPSDRFGSARALRNALETATRALAGDPGTQAPVLGATQARPTSPALSPSTPTPPIGYPATQVRPPPQPAVMHLEPLAPRPSSGGGRTALAVLLVVLLLAGAGAGVWAFVNKQKSDSLKPVASAIDSLSGQKLSYQLGETSASCVAQKVVDAAGGGTDTKELGAQIAADWPTLDTDQADTVASAVIGCSSSVYDRLVSDVLKNQPDLSASCVRRELTKARMSDMLTRELSGTGEQVQGDISAFVADC